MENIELYSQLDSDFMRLENSYYRIKNDMMRMVASSSGFYNWFRCHLLSCETELEAYQITDARFRLLFGVSKYESFEDFQKSQKVNVVSESSISRNMLIRFFYLKGFKTWEQFKPMILAFYPDVSSEKLHDFYTNKSVHPPAIEKVYFVYQILS